jgi:aquaporin Z
MTTQTSSVGAIARYEQNVMDRITDFDDPRQEWRRLFSELLGTFFLVLVAAGGGMMSHAFPGVISRQAAVVAPALMVLGVILFMGKISGAHLNPAVSIAFALRRDFPWRRVPGYIVVPLIGATLAALFLHAVISVSASNGSNYVASNYSSWDGFWMELILTMGLVSVILGTASGGQNVGVRRARRRGLHRAAWPVGQPDLRSVDEPGPHLRP